MSRKHWSPKSILFVALLATVAIACADGLSVENPPTSPLAGLKEAQSNDSSDPGGPNDTVGTLPNPSAPGYVHGTVLGPSQPGAGNDSLNTAPRVAGVKVTAYPRVAPFPGDSIGVGPAVATVTTGADGKFQLPPLAGGEYIVSFVPPEGSIYGGVWVWGPIHDRSHEWPWWVVLWKKAP